MAGDYECAVKVLSRYIQKDFVQLAYNLPPSFDFWSLMEEEIDIAAHKATHGDIKAFIEFLSVFFTRNVVEDVVEKFVFLSHSFLGLQYTLRKGYAEVAKSILADLHQYPPLLNFFGCVSLECESVFSEPQYVTATLVPQGESPHVPNADGEEDEGESSERSRRENDDRGEGARDRYDEYDAQRGGDGGDDSNETVDQFSALEQHTVVIQMSPFNIPPKGDYTKSPTLKARFEEFINSGICGDLSNIKRIYDPRYSTKGQVLFYHGTRTSSLTGFRSDGISPKHTRNEFSVGRAFYVSNSLRLAYEHPLHKHVSQGEDPVSVLVFELDVLMLHRKKISPGETSPFKYKWFPCHNPGEEKKWAEFCSKNMDSKAPPHDYDLVIGPICYRGGDGFAKLFGEMPGKISFTQVAFCTPRARSWLQKSFKRLYKEKRSNGPEAQS